MKLTTIKINSEIKKAAKIQAVLNEISISKHINTIVNIYKEDILKMINENNELVRKFTDKKDTSFIIEIEDDIRNFCKENRITIREAVIVAIMIYKQKHN